MLPVALLDAELSQTFNVQKTPTISVKHKTVRYAHIVLCARLLLSVVLARTIPILLHVSSVHSSLLLNVFYSVDAVPSIVC